MVCEPNPGVLDFQDAVFGPITYDLVSLLRDAYVAWSEEQQLDWAVRHWERARAAGLPVNGDFGAFWRDFEWMGVQRQLKVLGIFARLYHRDGKDAYLQDMPRVMGYLRGACARYNELRPALAASRRTRGASGHRRVHLLRRPAVARAMILAAGRGERMRPLSDTRPKPLLEAGGKPLIAWQIERLVAAGFSDIVVNVAHLGEQIEAALGNGVALRRKAALLARNRAARSRRRHRHRAAAAGRRRRAGGQRGRLRGIRLRVAAAAPGRDGGLDRRRRTCTW